MARKNGKQQDPQAPEGFDVSVGREESTGWVSKIPGTIVQGQLLGRHEYKRKSGKLQGYYQVKLMVPCKVQIESDEVDEDTGLNKREDIEAPIGSIVNFEENASMKDLASAAEKVERGAVINLWTGYKAKEPNRGAEGNHWVMYPPRLQIVKGPTVVKEKAGQDQVPF